MNHDDLVATFGQTVGVEKAEALVAGAAEELDVDPGGAYSPHEVVDICETIRRATDGYLPVVATEIRAQQQAQRRFDALLDELADPVVTVSFEPGVPTVTATNRAFEDVFGYDAETAEGRPLTDLVGPVPGEDALDWWLRSDRTGGVEVERRAADGEMRTFLFRSVVVSRENGHVEGYGIFTDVTDRKRRERRLRHQNEQLERFARAVTHDLRNPLQVASGRLEIALRTAEGETREQLETVRDAHARMEGLIDDLLTLARQGQVVDGTATVDLAAVARQAWSTVDAPGAELTVEDDVGAVEADRPRLRLLLENLFGNAVEHGAGDDRDGSDAEDRDDCDAEERDSSDAEERDSSDAEERDDSDDDDREADGDVASVAVRVGPLPGGFYVADDGPGIPPGERDRVFEHGFSARSNGSGFGLAIVKAVADAHEWDVDVGESDGGGARFEVTGVDRPAETA